MNEEEYKVEATATDSIGTYQPVEEPKVVKESDIKKDLEQAQKKYLASLGIGPDGRRIGHPEWVLQGIQKGVPLWAYDWSVIDSKSKYPPEKLRELRKERGVGSSKLRKKNLTKA